MQFTSSRFHCPSAWVELKTLRQKARSALWMALVCAVLVHLFLMQVNVFRSEQRTAKPLTTQFVKRQPRLTKPLELKKRPRVKRRRMQRRMVSVPLKAKRKEVAAVFQVPQVLRSLASPQMSVGRYVAFGTAELEPETVAQTFEGTREPDHKIDMSLEMMDIEALDTGLHHAMVIQDPNDKRNVRGFFHVAIAYSKSMHINFRTGTYYSDSYALYALVNAMNEHTDIKTNVRGAYTFDSLQLFRIPFILICFNGSWGGFKITHSESKNLGRYWLSGGMPSSTTDTG